MGPRGLTASKAPRPFLDGEDFRAVEGGRLVLGSRAPQQHPDRAPQTPELPLYQSLAAPLPHLQPVRQHPSLLLSVGEACPTFQLACLQGQGRSAGAQVPCPCH